MPMSGQGSSGEGQSWTQPRPDEDVLQPQEMNREAEGLHEPYVETPHSHCGANHLRCSVYLLSENRSNDHDLVCPVFSPLPPADRILASAFRRRQVARTETRRLWILTGR